MIVRDKSDLTTLSLLFTMRGSIVPAIMPQIIAAAVVGAIAALIREVYPDTRADDATFYTFTPFTALGVAVSLFLGFRNNACYDRWWEARKLWGKQLIEVRNLARLLQASGCPHEGRRAVARLSVAHSHALRAQLRGDATANDDANRFLSADELAAAAQQRNPADGILRVAAARVGEMQRAGEIDSYWAVALGGQINELGHVQGACERIASTPLPFPYTLLVGRTAHMYILLAPFAMAADLGWWTIVFNALLAYTFFGLDELARQLERPFGWEPQCLALSAICRTIEISVAEALEEESPSPLQPDRYLLM